MIYYKTTNPYVNGRREWDADMTAYLRDYPDNAVDDMEDSAIVYVRRIDNVLLKTPFVEVPHNGKDGEIRFEIALNVRKKAIAEQHLEMVQKGLSDANSRLQASIEKMEVIDVDGDGSSDVESDQNAMTMLGKLRTWLGI